MSEKKTAKVGASAKEKIGLPRYSSVDIAAWVERTVDDDQDDDMKVKEGLDACAELVENQLRERRVEILKIVQESGG